MFRLIFGSSGEAHQQLQDVFIEVALFQCVLLLFLESGALNREADGSAESDSLLMKRSRWPLTLVCVCVFTLLIPEL